MNKKIILVGSLTVIFDQLTKLILLHTLNTYGNITIIKNFFNLTYTENTGGAFSLFSSQTYILIIISLLAMLYIIKYMPSFKENKRNKLGFGLLLGGIGGNLVDRLFRGYVIDFLDFNIFGYNYPIFNFGDIAIFFGVLLLIIAILKGEDNENSSKNNGRENR